MSVQIDAVTVIDAVRRILMDNAEIRDLAFSLINEDDRETRRKIAREIIDANLRVVEVVSKLSDAPMSSDGSVYWA